jgi:hypothetical protein
VGRGRRLGGSTPQEAAADPRPRPCVTRPARLSVVRLQRELRVGHEYLAPFAVSGSGLCFELVHLGSSTSRSSGNEVILITMALANPPSLVEYRVEGLELRFLIFDAPTDANLPYYLQVSIR